jgi:DnaK suppressor protein
MTVTKSPAKRAAPAKKSAGKASAAPHKALAKKTARPVAKAEKKPTAKAAAKSGKKPAAKPVAKPVAKSAAKGAGHPAKKPAVKAAPAAPAKTTANKSVAHAPNAAPVTKSHPSSDAKPIVKAPAKAGSGQPVLNQPPPRAPTRTARSNFHVSVPVPDPVQVSRFADRFAPTRSPARQVAVDAPVRAPVKFDPKLVNAWKTKSGRDLTEPELLAMPEAEYMNEKQLEFFRVRLTALKDDLLSNAGETTEHLREDTSIVPDPADRATIEEEHALELRTRDRERKLLKKISQSLGRIEAGDYGYCDETGEPIGLARLLARPTATLSLEAQQRREMKQKMFGD